MIWNLLSPRLAAIVFAFAIEFVGLTSVGPKMELELTGDGRDWVHLRAVATDRETSPVPQFGSRRLAERLKALEINCCYEEFDGTHSAIDWRLDHVLPYLAQSLNNALKNSTDGSN